MRVGVVREVKPNATLPDVRALAAEGPAVLDRHPAPARGLNVRAGRVVHDGVAATFPALAGAA